MKKLLNVVLLVFLFGFSTFSQTNSTQANANQISIFIDCNYCDINHIKKEIPYVNYVRDRKDADVHIIITTQTTGAGGEEFAISFNGQRDFKKMTDTIKFVSLPNSSEEDIRAGQIRTIKFGLIRYIAKTPMANMFSVDYSQETTTEIVDKWDNWICELNLGGWGHGEESYSNFSIWANASANRITEDWKIEMSLSNRNSKSVYKLNTTDYINKNTNRQFNGLVVKSMGEHWSSGIQVELGSSTYNNIKLNYSANAAIEYNIFPYSESTTKQLRILYMAGYSHHDYIDTTLYNKISEDLLRQDLDIAFKYIAKWGSLGVGASGGAYLHDFTKNNLSVSTEINLNLLRGLSVNLSLYTNLIHDQLSLPNTAATQEEVLLQQRQLATQYSYYTNFGISYTFGSIYNNVVNPRFGY